MYEYLFQNPCTISLHFIIKNERRFSYIIKSIIGMQEKAHRGRLPQGQLSQREAYYGKVKCIKGLTCLSNEG